MIEAPPFDGAHANRRQRHHAPPRDPGKTELVGLAPCPRNGRDDLKPGVYPKRAAPARTIYIPKLHSQRPIRVQRKIRSALCG